METEGKLRVAEVFVGVHDPRQSAKVEHDLVELLVVAVCGRPCKTSATQTGRENSLKL
jgi:hypothetical protein